jgi:hypothetical protein
MLYQQFVDDIELSGDWPALELGRSFEVAPIVNVEIE